MVRESVTRAVVVSSIVLAAEVRAQADRACDKCESHKKCTIEVMLLKAKAARQTCGAFTPKEGQ
jgi:hypothetical protein